MRRTQAQEMRVQELALQPWQHSALTVGRIARYRVPDRGEVHAQLVRATGLEQCFGECPTAQAIAYPEMRLCRATVRADRHALSIARVASDWSVDHALVFVEAAPNQQQVALLGRPTLH